MKKIIAALVILGTLAATPANAWYRGGGWGGGAYGARGNFNQYNYYGGGWNRGYYGGGYGAALGVAAGAAIIGGALGAISSQPYYYNGPAGPAYGYGGYYCQNFPVYDAWGRTIGFRC